MVLACRAIARCRARRQGGVDAAERGFVATFARERTGEPGEVAGWRLGPPTLVGIAAVDVHQQPSQGAHVLVVVADDVDEGSRLAEAQEVQVSGRDLPARNICVAAKPQQLSFDGGEARVRHPVAKHATHQRQQVQMPGMERRVGAGHPIPGDEQRPVEAAAVVRDQPAVAWNVAGEFAEERGLVGMVRQQQLDLPEPAALPPAEPDEKGERPRRGRQARRLRVKAEQGSVGRRLPGQRRQP
jgi:hypothetical protein